MNNSGTVETSPEAAAGACESGEASGDSQAPRRDGPSPEAQAIEAELLGCLPDLRAYARSLTRNRPDADDLVQDAVLRMINSADRYQQGTNFKAWAFTILRNRFLNEFVAKRKMTQEMDDSALERVAVSAKQDEGLELTDFQRIFHSLPEDHRSILALVAGSGMPYEDVARILGCAVGTVKSRVHRARAALFTLLEAQHAGEGKETPRFHRSSSLEERRRLVG
ncbi:sigma-70 family RNA polymerase sigma factor [Roseomonas sp. 18066]|uniref:sigma-70 family RNA polymerase sigma factor n=1 Tax=Roseomonas sp. 18066 TaxID=2681412 RepID=UPI001F48CEF2|nr:sigma-70 family RNA polymerase sigma factor [Roseomonas sp. 18066]